MRGPGHRLGCALTFTCMCGATHQRTGTNLSSNISQNYPLPSLAACDYSSFFPGSRKQVTFQDVLCKFISTSVSPTKSEPCDGLGAGMGRRSLASKSLMVPSSVRAAQLVVTVARCPVRCPAHNRCSVIIFSQGRRAVAQLCSLVNE